MLGHRFFSRRELLPTTRELVTISSAEMMGCSTPDTASGNAIRLYEKAQTRFCLMMEKHREELVSPFCTEDTTIPSYLFDERESIRLHIEVTRKWWNEEAHNFDVWASEATLDEISEGHYQKKQELLTFVAGMPLLMPDAQIVDIAQIYLDNLCHAPSRGMPCIWPMPRFIKMIFC